MSPFRKPHDMKEPTVNSKFINYFRTNKFINNRNILEHIKNLRKFTRRYWYIVFPLHGVLTVAYVSIFYLASRRSEKLLKYFDIKPDSMEAHEYFPKIPKKTFEEIGITLILLKLSSPLRLTTTLLGSKYLVKFMKSKKLIKCLMVRDVDKIVTNEVAYK